MRQTASVEVSVSSISLVLPLAVCVLIGGLSGCSRATTEVPPVATVGVGDAEASLSDDTAPTEDSTSGAPEKGKTAGTSTDQTGNVSAQLATFGAGCFWCVEAVFEQLKGVNVDSVKSGYAGGTAEDAVYDVVSRGTTGHAEVIQFEFDPSVISYEELLEVFWTSHDPTTPNQQGYDVGPQYRSVVMFHSDEQKEAAERWKKKLTDENAFGAPVVTEIVPFKGFYTAEGYHQDYFALNSSKPYCQRIIQPKLEKVRKVFKDRLRESTAP